MNSYRVFRTLGAAGVPLSFSVLAHASYITPIVAELPEYAGAVPRPGLTLYGVVDLALNYQNAGGKSVIPLQSGGRSTSRFGLMGKEDLGGGLAAEFSLENGFNADSGALGANGVIFNRQAWVGLASPAFGQLRLGNQDNVGYPVYLDPFGQVGTNSIYTSLGYAVVQTPTGSGFNADLGPGATQVAARVANAVSWNSPRVAGFNLKLLHAFSNSASAPSRTNNDGAMLTWARGPAALFGTYNRVWSAPVVLAPGQTATSVRNDLYSVGGLYDSGSWVLMGGFTQNAPHRAEAGIARNYTIGGIFPFGRHVLRASLLYRDTSGVRDRSGELAKDAGFGGMFGYDYLLSKRTSLYGRAGFIRNFGISTVPFNGNSLPTIEGSTVPRTGVSPITVSLGMAHAF